MPIYSNFKHLLIAAIISLATAGSASAEQISFASSSVYGGKKVSLTGVLKVPSGSGKRPLVILMHGCGGLSPLVNKALNKHAGALRSHGYATLILDSFDPRSIKDTWVCAKVSRLASARHYRQRDVSDAIKHLESNPNIDTRNVFLLGQSNGGSTILEMIRSKHASKIKAVATYYPWCVIVPGQSRVPLLILVGDKDDWISPQDCTDRNNPGGGVTTITYKGATHSFDLNMAEVVLYGHRMRGDRAATSDSRKRIIRFFNKYR